MNNMKSREQIIKERSMPYDGPGPTYKEILERLTSHLSSQRRSEVISQATMNKDEPSTEVTFLKNSHKI